MDCVFCKIIKGDLPSYKIFEDEWTLAFLDISKDVDGHTLVIPKKHCTNILDCEEDVLKKVMETVQKISKHYVQNCGYSAVNVLNANGASAGQSVFHLHFHIFPRTENDGANLWVQNKLAKLELSEMANKLKIQL